MRHIFAILFTFITCNIQAQVLTSNGKWEGIGDVNLSIVTSDADNGDGIGDGALYIDGQSMVSGQGASYTFGGAMQLGESFSISTHTYNVNSSYVRFSIELYNATDNLILANSGSITITSSTPPVLTHLNYTAQASDAGDVLQVRYIRNDPGDTYRNLLIDNLSLNGTFISLALSGTCPFTVTPDLPLIPSNATIESEIELAISRFSDDYLGTTAPSASALSKAETDYSALGITVSGGEINGNATIFFDDVKFLRVFARHLKFNPGDTSIREKANNTVWWVSKQFCSGTLVKDDPLYSYENFARPASLLKDFLDAKVKDLFAYTLYEHSREFQHYWVANYDESYIELNDAIDTDIIYNISDVLLAYTAWHDTADERYRYITAYNRFMERFFSYSPGTSNGIKEDGSGFHHWTAYNNYLYAYKTAASIIYHLRGTSFQVTQQSYKIFRDAVYAQYMQSNDDGVQALSTNGRRPELRIRQFNQSSLKQLAIAGGDILGLSTADPILAGMYNRIHGVDTDFNYTGQEPFTEGFFQFNHAHAGAFRKNDWVAFNKGFSNNMWGSEIYLTFNRYGRYQSYGALEVLYPGSREIGNGYDVNTWDWNYSSGTTVIKLPWEKLHAEKARIDELQQKRFVGTLALKNKNSEVLSNTHGSFGMFAMDFQEREGLGFSTVFSSENHNTSFTFKKSSFYFDDITVCLGSNISNDDTSNETITTLYQRIDNAGKAPNVNGAPQSVSGEVTFNGTSNNWVISNYNTGFYIFSGNNHHLKVKKELQQTPNHNQLWPVDFSSNPTDTYYIGYLDHGTNPSDKSYEYVMLPSTNSSEMQLLDAAIQANNKPYKVHQQDTNAHIVEHISKNIFGYAFFNSASDLTFGSIKGVDGSCLVMTQLDTSSQSLLLSITDPDVGFESRSYVPSVLRTKTVILKGEWSLINPVSGVQIVSANTAETIIEFQLVDGLPKEILLSNNGNLSSEKKIVKEVLIFPNPSKGIIKFSSEYNISSVKLFSLEGKEIGVFNINDNTIHLKNLQEGIYILELNLVDGGIVSKKIIIQK